MEMASQLAFAASQMFQLLVRLGIVPIQLHCELIGIFDHMDILDVLVRDFFESEASRCNVLDESATRKQFEHVRPDFGWNAQKNAETRTSLLFQSWFL
jgi:hypothetical protein